VTVFTLTKVMCCAISLLELEFLMTRANSLYG